MKYKTWTLFLAVLFCSIDYSQSCSCNRAHPQEHYCNSDFVILARVKKMQIVNETFYPNYKIPTKVYKVRVRKEFKISEKGLVALKSGKIHTPLDSSTCGVNLQVGKLYVLSGQINSLRANINLCRMALEWNTLTRRQRKGLKMMYKRGCGCQIQSCSSSSKWCNHSKSKDTCHWWSKCEIEEGICLRQNHGYCAWNRNKKLTACRADLALQSNSTTTEKPKHNLLRVYSQDRPLTIV